MINVWGTYCNPCLSEMPALGELAAEYDPAQFQLVGVVCDVMENDSTKNIDYAKQLITETKANYPHLLANESVYMSFLGAVSAVPTTFFVRQDGSLIGYLTGALEKENWKALIDDLLSEEQ
jgi:thiol-disulfide isomerase/thioredoxin